MSEATTDDKLRAFERAVRELDDARLREAEAKERYDDADIELRAARSRVRDAHNKANVALVALNLDGAR